MVTKISKLTGKEIEIVLEYLKQENIELLIYDNTLTYNEESLFSLPEDVSVQG